MRISDWSSDVCSSDLDDLAFDRAVGRGHERVEACKIGDLALDALGPGRAAVAEGCDRERLRQEGPGQPCLLLTALPDRHLIGFLAHRSEEHTSELQSLMRISYAVFCLKKKNIKKA